MRMVVMPSYQFYPQSTFLKDSVSKFHARKTPNFFDSGKQLCFCTTGGSDFRPRNNLRKKGLNVLPKSSNGGLRFSSEDCGAVSSRRSWLEDWNERIRPNQGSGPQAAVNYRNRGDVSSSDAEEGTSTSTGGNTMERIVQKLKKFGYMDDVSEQNESRGVIEKGSVEDIFHVEEGLLPNARGGVSTKFPFGDESVSMGSGGQVRFPWEKDDSIEQKRSLDSRKHRNLAQLTLPASELTRLTNLALRIKNKMRIGGAGVTQQVVETIHEKWKSSEVVRVKIEGPPALNMRRMHDIMERKTGGLVIWRSGTSIALYRGVTYEDPAQKLKKKIFRRHDISQKRPSASEKTIEDFPNFGPSADTDRPQVKPISIERNKSNLETPSEVRYEDEIDQLLDSLGPRYVDWPGEGPLPVDADLLPGIVPGYQPPFRLLPYGVRSTLAMKEATALRRLARGLPPHFALGRSRQHQGLAAAITKLWERSSIVKIAIKRGVQLTTSERMAEELKRLTGGMLLSRNKDFLVYYRGKDFLSPDVAEALIEKERLARALQDEEEQARLRAAAFLSPRVQESDEPGTAGTLKETLDADTRWGKHLDDDHEKKMKREAEVLRHANLVWKLEKKLAFAEKKLRKAELALSKVEGFLNPADRVEDPEELTDEERFMFRKLGLRMKAFLLLGRRGVFSGTVENMHLHWKYRELVKIIVKARNIEEARDIALSLEAESGGVLVSVDKISKGYAIVVFRGRDYKRPPLLRPKNLLTKRKALARSIELQRRQDLLNHMSTLQTRVKQLQSELDQMAAVQEQGDEELYNKLDLAYPTEDDSEEEGDGDHLEISDTENDMDDETDNSMDDADLETNFPYDIQDGLEAESAEP